MDAIEKQLVVDPRARPRAAWPGVERSLISSGTLVSEMLMRQNDLGLAGHGAAAKGGINLSHFRYKRTDRGSAAPKDRTGI